MYRLSSILFDQVLTNCNLGNSNLTTGRDDPYSRDKAKTINDADSSSNYNTIIIQTPTQISIGFSRARFLRIEVWKRKQNDSMNLPKRKLKHQHLVCEAFQNHRVYDLVVFREMINRCFCYDFDENHQPIPTRSTNFEQLRNPSLLTVSVRSFIIHILVCQSAFMLF